MKKMKLSKEELIHLCEKSSLTGRSGNGFLVSKKLEALHLNVKIKENELPQDKGILVMNLQTVIAIAELTQDR